MQEGEGEMELVFSRIEHLSTTACPNKPCSVVHTHGCPLGYFYCAAEDADTKRAETQRLVKLFEEGKELIDAVAIAGCEPLMQPASLELAAQLRERGFDIELHTTGYYPSALERAVEEGHADVVESDKVTATLAPPVFSHDDLYELAQAPACYGFKKLKLRNYPSEGVAAPWLLSTRGKALHRKGVVTCFSGRWSDSN